MSIEKILLPSPKFESIQEIKETKLPQSLCKNYQVKCLANHKLSYQTTKDSALISKPKTSKYSLNVEKNILEKHWCDTCEEWLNSFDEFREHRRKHITCGVNGCSFRAGSNVISKHIEEIHSSGLYDKICRVSSPEEIAKWREERKKRYPTLANVILREKAQKERFKRGEKLEDPKNRFGKKYDRRQMIKSDILQKKQNQKLDFSKKKLSRKHKQFDSKKSISNKRSDDLTCENKGRKEKNKNVNAIENSTETDGYINGILPFKGTKNLVDYERPKEYQTQLNSLKNIADMYGSDVSETDYESDVEMEREQKPKNSISSEKNVIDPVINLNTRETKSEEKENSKVLINELSVEANNEFLNCTNNIIVNENETNIDTLNESDNEMPEEQPILKIKEENLNTKSESINPSIKPNLTQTKNKQSINSKTKKSGLNYAKLRNYRPNTLLEKLLQKEIRHERNILLQCVRFVVENNFFEDKK